MATSVQKVSNFYLKEIENELKTIFVDMTPAQKNLVVTAINKTNDLLQATKNTKYPLGWNDLDQSSIQETFKRIALLGFNLDAYPAQAYVCLRGKKLTFAPQGDGWRTIVDKFGYQVKRTYTPWIVREGDEYKAPHYKGIEITPPEWTPNGTGKVLKVVCPIEYTDGHIEYLVSEREDAKVNLLAHVVNNLMKKDESGKNKANLNDCMKIAANKTLDELLVDDEFILKGNVSPAWRGVASEQMIITKMKNNVYRKVHTNDETLEIMLNEAYSESEETTIIDATPKAIEAPDAKTPKTIPAVLQNAKKTAVEETKPVEEPKEKIPTAPVPEEVNQDTGEVVDDGKANAEADEEFPF